MVSVIIRTKNEERWIAQCIKKIKSQSITDIEIVLVDNKSTDKTITRARHEFPGIKVIELDEYRPGLAINEGIRASAGHYIAILSSHCLPVDENWLQHLMDNLNQPLVAGVYGRQIPMRFTSSVDKRDLLLTFGLDKRLQKKDSFFHNANSMIRRETWEKYPFDENITNIEDRVWGKMMIEAGYTLVYEPEAAVHHYHGIHQNNNKERVDNVVQILEGLNLHKSHRGADYMDPSKLEIAAIIPVKLDKENEEIIDILLERTIRPTLTSSYINRIIVSSDSKVIAEKITALGAEAPFLRPPELSENDIRVDEVLNYTLEQLELQEYYPDIVVPLEIIHPFRPAGLIDHLIEHFSTHRSEREPLHIGLISLGCATYPEIIRRGSRLGERVGLFEIKDPISTIEIRNQDDMDAVRKYISEFS
jgi:glycosyltransferase involved in cell wall biosynthesis